MTLADAKAQLASINSTFVEFEGAALDALFAAIMDVVPGWKAPNIKTMIVASPPAGQEDTFPHVVFAGFNDKGCFDGKANVKLEVYKAIILALQKRSAGN